MSNRLLFGGICFSLALVAATAAVPGLRELFYCSPVSLNHWLIMIGLSVTPLIVVKIQKLFIRRKASVRI